MRKSKRQVGSKVVAHGEVRTTVLDTALIEARQVRSKRMLSTCRVIAPAVGALLITVTPAFWPVMAAQTLIGVSSSVLGPTAVAISLGVVGRTLFDRRQGRNQTFNLLLIAFGVLPVRGVLYTLTHSTPVLVAVQILDGIAAAIFGIVSVLAIADLTIGTGRFNLTPGAVTTAERRLRLRRYLTTSFAVFDLHSHGIRIPSTCNQ